MLGFLQRCSHEVESVLESSSAFKELTTCRDSIFHLRKLSPLESFSIYWVEFFFFFLKPLPFVLNFISWVHTSHPCFPWPPLLIPSRMWFQSMLMNQQYELNKIPISKNTHKSRLCVNWLIKMWLETHRNIALFFPLGEMVQNSR